MRSYIHTAMIAALAISAILSAERDSLADDGELLAEGARVYATVAGLGCKTCHGEFAEGDLGVGPFIRGASEGSIRAAIEATNEMLVVKQSITDAEISAVAAYIRYLGTMQVVRTLVKRGRFLPDQASVRPGTRVQLVVQNAGLDTHTFRSDNMGMADVVIPGRSAASREWLAPGEEGEFSLYCIDCKLDKQSLTLRIDKAAQGFVPAHL